MYTKEEATRLREGFWIAFGRYMARHLSADGEKVAWVNYKTGIRHIYFRMQADNKEATIAIEFQHPDAGLRELYFEQAQQLKTMLHAALDEEWEWQQDATDEYGKPLSRIGTTLPGVSIYKQEDWPAIISFLKPRILALDAFWSTARYAFEALA